MLRTLASFWTWTVLGLLLLFMVPLLALTIGVTWPFDRERYWTGRIFRQVGVLTAKANPLWHFRWAGTPPVDPRRPFVVVSNHESFSDILLISHLPWEMKWLSKAEIMRIPFIGWCMKLAGDIPVWRGKVDSARNAMATARDALAKHDWRMNPARATVTVLEPIETTGLTLDDVAALKERVRDVIAQARERLRVQT